LQVLAVVGAMSAFAATGMAQTSTKGTVVAKKKQPVTKQQIAQQIRSGHSPLPGKQVGHDKTAAHNESVTKGAMPQFITADTPPIRIVPNQAAPAPRGGGDGTDDCASGTAISGTGLVATGNAGATNTPGDVAAGVCGASATNIDVWFTYTPANTGTARFSFCVADGASTTYDTTMEAYTNCPSLGGTRIICNDDSCDGLSSAIQPSVTAGVPIKIRVTGFSTASGTGVMFYRDASGGGGLPNDLCTGAITVTDGRTPYSAVGANTDVAGSCAPANNDVWFRYVSSCTGNVTISTCDAARTYDTTMQVFAGSCNGPLVSCNDDGPPACANPPALFSGSTCVFAANTGDVFFIQVAAYGTDPVGSSALNVSCALPPEPICFFDPPTQCQDTSAAIAYNVTNFNVAESFNSTAAGSVTEICIKGLYFGGVQVPSDWTIALYDSDGQGLPLNILNTYSESGATMVVTSRDTLTTFAGRPVLEYHFALNQPTAIAANTCYWARFENIAAGDSFFVEDGDASNGNLQMLQNGAGNYVYTTASLVPDDLNMCVSVASLNAGACTIDRCPNGAPPNDSCAGAAPISNGDSVPVDTTCATVDGVATCSGDIEANSVWFSVAGNGNDVTIDMCAGPGYDTRLEVYTGTCGSLTCVGSNDDFCGLQSGITFCTTPGVTYLVMLHGFAGSTGAATMTRTDGAPCVPCTGVTCAPDAVDEGEGCGGDTNGGCNAPVPPVYQAVTCNQTIHGTLFADGGTRDTDWYSVTVPDSGTVSATFTSAIPTISFVLTFAPDCTAINLAAQAHVDPCDVATVSASGLAPGSLAVIFFATGNADGSGIFAGFPCGFATGNDYCATFDVGVTCNNCPCDFNHDGRLNSQDFFDFLACFFTAGCPQGDYNGDHIINSQDFFDFLACFFAPPAGCN
jgi:hypothetical protein